jgi:hypothetical protein
MPSTSAANSLPIGMNRMGISMVFAIITRSARGRHAGL